MKSPNSSTFSTEFSHYTLYIAMDGINEQKPTDMQPFSDPAVLTLRV